MSSRRLRAAQSRGVLIAALVLQIFSTLIHAETITLSSSTITYTTNTHSSSSPSLRLKPSSAPAPLTLRSARNPSLTTVNTCGGSYKQALECNRPCPTGSDWECPHNQKCFSNITCRTPVKPSIGRKPQNACGVSYKDAKKCTAGCPSGMDSECPHGQHCFAGMVCEPRVSLRSKIYKTIFGMGWVMDY